MPFPGLIAGMRGRDGQATRGGQRGASRKVFALVGAGVVGVGLLAGGTTYALHRSTSVIPSDITREATFRIWVPVEGAEGIAVNRDSVQFDHGNGSLTYVVAIDGENVTVSEQAAPETFSQPGVYDFKLQQAREFQTIHTRMGEVALTKPAELAGHVVAMIWAGDALLFANPHATLSDAQWKRLFDAMQSGR